MPDEQTTEDRRKERRRALAFHEAGHAVVGILGGILVDRVTIVPTATFSGQVSYRSAEPVRAPAQQIIAVVSRQLAGSIAQAIHMGQGDMRAASIDLTNAAEQIDRALGTTPTAARSEAIQQILNHTAIVLRTHWASVEAVAEALLERGTLSGAQVDAIIKGPR